MSSILKTGQDLLNLCLNKLDPNLLGRGSGCGLERIPSVRSVTFSRISSAERIERLRVSHRPNHNCTKLYTPTRARTSGACFSPPARERHVRRAVICARRNVMRVGLAHGRRRCDRGERCELVAPHEARLGFANHCTPRRAHERGKLPADLRGALRVVGVGGRRCARRPPSTATIALR